MILARRKLCISVLAALIAIGAVVGLYFAVTYDNKPSVASSKGLSSPETSLPPGVSTPEPSATNLNKICEDNPIKFKAGVVTNGVECAEIGSSILKRNGSAADAAIAALFCEGVAQPQSMGLGGGFLLTIYTRATGHVETLDAREVAPLKATEDMYGGNASLSSRGALSIAVPGELRGYWELHKRYGKLEWKELVQPTIDLCKKGHLVTPYLANVLKGKEQIILNEPSLREIFVDPSTNRTWKEGEKIKRVKLAESLEIIAKEGGDVLYTGRLAKLLVQDIQELGGIITEEDLRNYKPRWQEPVIADLRNNLTLYTAPLPGSGVILSFILNILRGYINTISPITSQDWHRIVESFKFGYGRRTELGDIEGLQELISNLTSSQYAEGIRHKIFDNTTFQDPEYYGANYSLVEDHGTAHINVLAANGDAVSVTSTINLMLGSKVRSKSTGIILNDEMDDFSAPNITNAYDLPPAPANYIKPGKRPLSSMCPSIIVDGHGDVRLIVGSAGGSKITTSTALVTIRNIWLNNSLKESVYAKRLHHQLFPMAIQYEEDFDKEIVKYLTSKGHESKFVNSKDGFAAVTAISRQCNTVFGYYDIRRQGSGRELTAGNRTYEQINIVIYRDLLPNKITTSSNGAVKTRRLATASEGKNMSPVFQNATPRKWAIIRSHSMLRNISSKRSITASNGSYEILQTLYSSTIRTIIQ